MDLEGGRSMNEPINIIEETFSLAWAQAIKILESHAWEAWNLIVTIKHPTVVDSAIVQELNKFARSHGLILPQQVRTTIFPFRIYKHVQMGDRDRFYRWYNSFYKKTRKMSHSNWGTYFKRMISYKTQDGDEYDQLGNIIRHIKDRNRIYGAAYIMIIPQIGSETNKTMGAPCLNYIAVQVEEENANKKIHLLAVYRNHDFKERAFGNYWGLCELLEYICRETNSNVGSITCISSHAFIDNYKRELNGIADNILRNQNNEV